MAVEASLPQGSAITARAALRDRVSIAQLAQSADRPPSPLTEQRNRVVRVVAVLAADTGAGLGVAALLLGLPATDALLFGVGVAVALVPEGC